MNIFSPTSAPQDQTQSRLMRLAALFLGLYALILTLSPAVRLHNWQVDYRWQHWLGFIIWLVGFELVHRQTLRQFPVRDPYLLPIAAILSGWGLLTIYRLNITFGLRQSTWLALSLAIFWWGLQKPEILQLLRRYKYISLISALGLTALTFLFGTYPSGEGPELWLGFWGVYIQPSEPLKLLLIVYLSAYLADRLPFNFNLIQLLLPTLVLSGAALVMLLTQRDLGTSSLVIALYFLIIYLASGKRRILLLAIGLILVAGILGYQLYDVIQIRVEGWINPWLDSSGRSYQIIQSLLAIAAGGIIGRGPGIGSPGLVPVALSDFIFSAIAEEAGLVGTLGLLILLGLTAMRGVMTALRSKNSYYRLLSAGLTFYLVIQSVFIIGGNLRALPLTGVTLPFVSYGGSSLLTSYIALLFLLLISAQSEFEPLQAINARPYLFITGLVLVSLVGIGMINGWWAIIRSGDLLERPDNARYIIAARYVRRGDIVDRGNIPLAESAGQPGSYQRIYSYPALSPVIGYTHPVYGQTGLESSMDEYLRGMRGSPTSSVWSSYLLYGQLPPGLAVRLSIDLDLQQTADQLFDGQKGALVLLNAQNGEVLALSSHPNYNANQLDNTWDNLTQSKDAPLINRAVQGKYPLGTAFGPFMLANTTQHNLSDIPAKTGVTFNGQTWGCALPQSGQLNWEKLISAGCPGASEALGETLSLENIRQIYSEARFDRVPTVSLPSATADPATALSDTRLAALGQDGASVTPLQVVLAASALSTGGNIPTPRLALAVNTPIQGWVVLSPDEESHPGFTNNTSAGVEMLTVEGTPTWGSVGSAWVTVDQITWFIGGTLPEWKGTPLAIAIVIESKDPELAWQIGTTLLDRTIHP